MEVIQLAYHAGLDIFALLQAVLFVQYVQLVPTALMGPVLLPVQQDHTAHLFPQPPYLVLLGHGEK
jgi:hypothetical protein